MQKSKNDVTFKGRYLGILVMVISLSIVGLMHMFFGLALISWDLYFGSYSTTMNYSVYTLAYGSMTVVFTYLLWKEKRTGPAPNFAAIGEIPFSILILAYLFQDHIRPKYDI